MELIILLVIAVFIITYRKNTGENVYKFLLKKLQMYMTNMLLILLRWLERNLNN